MKKQHAVAFGLVVTAIVVASQLHGEGAQAADTASRWLSELGLDAEGIPVPIVLAQSSDEVVLDYGRSVSFDELTGQWTIALYESGYTKHEDHSSSDTRIVQVYTHEDERFVLAMAESEGSPIVALTRTDTPTEHWAVSGYGSPPTALQGIW